MFETWLARVPEGRGRGSGKGPDIVKYLQCFDVPTPGTEFRTFDARHRRDQCRLAAPSPPPLPPPASDRLPPRSKGPTGTEPSKWDPDARIRSRAPAGPLPAEASDKTRLRFGPPKATLTTIAALAALILGPSALGTFARGFPRLLQRLPNWTPSARLELWAILAVAAASVAVVVGRLAARGRRAAAPEALGAPSSRRRFLPPVELVLLVVGNLTFLAFAAIVAVAMLSFLATGLRAVAGFRPLATHHREVSLGIATAIFLIGLRPGTLGWRRLLTHWLRWSAVFALAVAGSAAASAAPDAAVLGRLEPSGPAGLYSLLLIGLALSYLLARAGRAKATGEDSFRPLGWFVPAVGLAWTAYLGLLALVLDGVFLTLRAHLA